LVRLARRGHDARSRFILAISLFCVLTVFSLIWFRKTTSVADLFFSTPHAATLNDSSEFGAAFTLTFLIAQLAVLCLLTPAYAAGGIAEEKDNQTFIFLLASELTAREIVFGKFLGRVFFLLGIMLAGLPILAICQIHGGASMLFVLLSYLITACTVIFLSAVGVACAASADTLRGALFRAYGLAAVIIFTGCGIYPLLSPLAIIPELFGLMRTGKWEWVWVCGIAYPVVELIAASIAIWLAVGSVRKMRAKLTPSMAKPPRRVLERYAREDKARAQYERELLQWEEAVAFEKQRRDTPTLTSQPEVAPQLILAPVEAQPEFADATEAAIEMKPIPMAAVSARQPVLPPKPMPKISIQPHPGRPITDFDAEVERPRIGNKDPFLWKEKYTSGSMKTEDDHAMKAMMYLFGAILGLFVLLFATIAVVSLASDRSGNNNREVKWLILTFGGATVFVHLLQIGMAACGTICKERQRLTLESLLTIPVERSEILWPKWWTCFARGWWWGGPSAVILAMAFLASDVPSLTLPAVVYFLLAAPFMNSVGIWLSIRCRSVNKALMWYLPITGCVLLAPVALCTWLAADQLLIGMVLMSLLTGSLAVGAWLFWHKSVTSFDRETVL